MNLIAFLVVKRDVPDESKTFLLQRGDDADLSRSREQVMSGHFRYEHMIQAQPRQRGGGLLWTRKCIRHLQHQKVLQAIVLPFLFHFRLAKGRRGVCNGVLVLV